MLHIVLFNTRDNGRPHATVNGPRKILNPLNPRPPTVLFSRSSSRLFGAAAGSQPCHLSPSFPHEGFEVAGVLPGLPRLQRAASSELVHGASPRSELPPRLGALRLRVLRCVSAYEELACSAVPANPTRSRAELCGRRPPLTSQLLCPEHVARPQPRVPENVLGIRTFSSKRSSPGAPAG